jgi:predicted site-specific integrase-resolvase
MPELRDPLVVTEREVARLLSVSRAALRRWRREGRGPEYTRLERRCVRYNLRSIETFVNKNLSGGKQALSSNSSPIVGGE